LDDGGEAVIMDLMIERRNNVAKYSVRLDGEWLQIDAATYCQIQDLQELIEEQELTMRSLVAEAAQKQVPF
jgi:hypothetical protein